MLIGIEIFLLLLLFFFFFDLLLLRSSSSIFLFILVYSCFFSINNYQKSLRFIQFRHVAVLGNPTDKRKVARVESVAEIVRCGGGRVSTDLSNALTHVLVDTAGSESAEDCGVPLKRLRQLVTLFFSLYFGEKLLILIDRLVLAFQLFDLAISTSSFFIHQDQIGPDFKQI